jgi:hypothetical protein
VGEVCEEPLAEDTSPPLTPEAPRKAAGVLQYPVPQRGDGLGRSALERPRHRDHRRATASERPSSRSWQGKPESTRPTTPIR